MNNDREIFYFMKLLPETAIIHLDNTVDQVKEGKNQFMDEISLLTNFLKDLCQVGKNFENEVFSLGERFQKSMESEIKDDKLSQCYQTIMNSLLKFTDNIQKTFFSFDTYKEAIQNYMKDYSTVVDLNVSEILKKLNHVEDSIVKNKDAIHKHFDYYNRNKKNLIENRRNRQREELESLCKRRENLRKALSNMIKKTIIFSDERLGEIAHFECSTKERIKKFTVSMSMALLTEKRDTTETIINKIDDNFCAFNCNVESVYVNSSLNFSPFVNIKNYEDISFEENNIKRLNILFDNKYNRYVLASVHQIDVDMTERKKLFVEMLVHNLYNTSIRITNRTLRLINEFIIDQQSCKYLIFNLILGKSRVLLEKPFDVIIVNDTQFLNFSDILKIILSTKADNPSICLESFYHLLKFSLSIFNNEYRNLAEMNSNYMLIKQTDFWIKMFEFFKGYLNPKQSEDGEILPFGDEKPTSQMEKFKEMFRYKRTNSGNKVKKNKTKTELAFEQCIYFILKCKLSFKEMSVILSKIIKYFKIDLYLVRNIIGKKKSDLLFLSESNDSFKNMINQQVKKSGYNDKNSKFYSVLKNAIVFLYDEKDLFRLITINKFIYGKKTKILNKILLCIEGLDPELRKKLITQNIIKALKNKEIKDNFKIEEIDPLIHLDMRRTQCGKDTEDRCRMELILTNICYSKEVNFSYYQGLNYITKYFYFVLEKNACITFRVIGSLLLNNFKKYFDIEFKNLKKLFFSLKTIIKLKLPTLFHYLESVRKIDLEVIFTAWCLTLFTNAHESLPGNRHLDHIIDIFISKSWPGLFRVIVILLSDLEKEILEASYDQILIIFSSLTKNGYIKSKSLCHLKKRVKKFKTINKNLLIALDDEYTHSQMKFDKIFNK